MSFKLASGPNSAEPAPYPPTANPTANPRLSGNHLAITGMGVAYPKPLPKPPITPKHTYSHIRLWVKLHKKKPRLTSIPPVREIQNGPNLSCSRPATINVRAKTTTAIPNTAEVCARFHPNSFSSGATNMLHAYSVPRAMFISSPPTTRHQRFSPVPPTSIESALFVIAVLISSLPSTRRENHITLHSRRQSDLRDC